MLYSIQYNGWFAASDLFDMFTRSIEFYYAFYYHVLRVEMWFIKQTVKMNGCSLQQVIR